MIVATDPSLAILFVLGMIIICSITKRKTK